jgi:hypothetical protein
MVIPPSGSQTTDGTSIPSRRRRFDCAPGSNQSQQFDRVPKRFGSFYLAIELDRSQEAQLLIDLKISHFAPHYCFMAVQQRFMLQTRQFGG